MTPRGPTAAIRGRGRAASAARAVAAAALAALLAAAPGAAQQGGGAAGGPGPSAVPVRDSALSELRLGERVRVEADGFDRVVGRYGGRRDGGFLVRTSRSPEKGVRVPAAALERLWTEETAADEGALRGAIVGGGLGAVASVILVAGVCQVECGDDYAVAVPLTAVAGGLAGAGVGALAGSLSTRWELAFPP